MISVFTSEQLSKLSKLSQHGLSLRANEEDLRRQLAQVALYIAECDAEIAAMFQGETGSSPTEEEQEPPNPVVKPKPFHTTRAVARMLAEAGSREELPTLDYAGGDPSNFEAGMEFLLGTPQWEQQEVLYRGETYRATDPTIKAWLQEYIPKVVEILDAIWGGHKSNDGHLNAAANKIPASRREFIRRMSPAFRKPEEHESRGLPDPAEHDREIRAHDERLD